MTDRHRDAVLDALVGLEGEEWDHVARMAELGVLTASLVHELRQPLFAIKAIAQLLESDADGAVRQRLHELVVQAGYAEKLIDHYGSYGSAPGPEVLLDANDPVRVAVEMLAHRIRPGGVHLVVDLAPGALLVRARRMALRQVVVNLLTNALDAVEGLTERKVWVRTRKDGEHAVIVVEDSGTGVRPDIRPRAFDAFVTSKAPGRGTGLGLAITARAVQEAGGTVDLLDGKDGGTRAEVRWPVAST